MATHGPSDKQRSKSKNGSIYGVTNKSGLKAHSGAVFIEHPLSFYNSGYSNTDQFD